MRQSYVKPNMSTYADIYFSAVTQNYITDLTNCESDSICNNGAASGGIEVCASGIADPSQLDGCLFVINTDCDPPSDVLNAGSLTDCALNPGVICPPGSLAVQCDITGSCESDDCNFLSSGMSCGGEFVPCPTNGIVIDE